MPDQRQWQIAGNAAETYEHALVPAVFAPWAPQVVALANPRPGDRVLDIACGTGVVTRLAAQHVGRTGNVIGLDLNPGMLAFAASLIPSDLPQMHRSRGGRLARRICLYPMRRTISCTVN
jgi:SAM-dependent methyltransferase